jgi:hypothetical protein
MRVAATGSSLRQLALRCTGRPLLAARRPGPAAARGLSGGAGAAEPELLMAAAGGLRVVDFNRPRQLNAPTGEQ